jgi:hypothetical protein
LQQQTASLLHPRSLRPLLPTAQTGMSLHATHVLPRGSTWHVAIWHTSFPTFDLPSPVLPSTCALPPRFDVSSFRFSFNLPTSAPPSMCPLPPTFDMPTPAHCPFAHLTCLLPPTRPTAHFRHHVTF